MIALRILDVKKFMAAFLVRETFDEYSLIEAQITTFCTFQIDGRLERDFFGDDGNGAETAGGAPAGARAGMTAAAKNGTAPGAAAKTGAAAVPGVTAANAAPGGGAAPFPSVEYIAWKQVRERCFDLIKGKRTPLAFKFVFFYPEAQRLGFLADAGVTVKPELVSGLCFNLRFDGTNLLLTTGTAMRSFTADRSADRAWDEEVKALLQRIGIAVEQL